MRTGQASFYGPDLQRRQGPRLNLAPPQVPDGFISHFYSVSEHVSPVLAFGFLGPKPQLAEVCAFFKVSSVLRPLLPPETAVLPLGLEPWRVQACRGRGLLLRKAGGT